MRDRDVLRPFRFPHNHNHNHNPLSVPPLVPPPQSEVAAIFTATAAKLLLYPVRVNYNLGFEVNRSPHVSLELWLMVLALGVEGVGDVVAMVVQKRQGLEHVSILSGSRWREMMLLSVCISMSTANLVLYGFSLRDVGMFCSDSDVGEFCGCSFVRQTKVLCEFCCTDGDCE